MSNLGAQATELGDLDRAVANYEASLAVARAAEEPEAMVLALHNLAHQEWQRGQTARAVSRLEQALEVAREHRMGWILPRSSSSGHHQHRPGRLSASRRVLSRKHRAGPAQRQSRGRHRRRRRAGTAGFCDRPAREGSPSVGAADAMREGLAMPLSSNEVASSSPS